MREDRLLEPASYYRDELKNSYSERLSALFESLTKKSGVDADVNRGTVSRLDDANGVLHKYRSRRSLWIFLLVLSLVVVAVAAYFTYDQVNGGSRLQEESLRMLAQIASLGFFGFLTVFSILRIIKYGRMIREQEKVVREIENLAWRQMSPLISMINTEDFCRIAHEVAPAIEIAPFIPSRLISRLKEREPSQNELFNHIRFMEREDITTISSLSGCVDGKPFMMMSYVAFRMGMAVYTGSISLPYVDHVTDSDGKVRTVTRYETLTASIEKPCPEYDSYHRAIYFSEACPDLTFLRSPINISAKSEKGFEKEIKKARKKFLKLEKKSMKNGGRTFTPLSDSAFEALFNTEDRDNDVEFRMMYTPYAIKQFTELVKSPDGFGDNFYLEKDGCCTSCILEGGQIGYSGGFRPDPAKIASYSYDVMKSRFSRYGEDFFRNFYFCLAPLFSVPIYADGRNEDFAAIMRESDEASYYQFDAESLASADPEAFRPIGTSTEVIIKAVDSRKYDYGTLFTMESHSFRAESRVEYVYKVGFHVSGNVPVHWTEYIPQTRRTQMLVRYLGVAKGQASAIAGKCSCSCRHVYKDGFMGLIVDGNEADSSKFASMMDSMSGLAKQIRGEVAQASGFERGAIDGLDELKKAVSSRTVRNIIGSAIAQEVLDDDAAAGQGGAGDGSGNVVEFDARDFEKTQSEK